MRLAVLGLGLIGGSLARAARAAGLAEHISGWDKDAGAMAAASQAGVIDRHHARATDAVKDADLVLLCVPPQAMPPLASAVATSLSPDAVVMDTASTKQQVADALREVLTAARYIPAHPIAGKAASGFEASEADLFEGRPVILCPALGIETDDPALLMAQHFWTGIGAHPVLMPADMHDLVYAHLSHLPQLLAWAAALTLDGEALEHDEPDVLRRFLRIGGSDPVLWMDILATNTPLIRRTLETSLALLGQMETELGKAPEGEEQRISPRVPGMFFPQLAASIAVTACSMLEQQGRIRLAPLAGPGFIDFTAPMDADPEPYLEAMSRHSAQLAGLVRRFSAVISELHGYMVQGQWKFLEERLREARAVHGRLSAQHLVQ